MTGKLYFSHDGVRGISQVHDDVRNQLSQLIGTAPDGSVIESSQGLIASPVTSALGAALPSRETVLGITQTASKAFSDLITKSLQMYEQGDAEAAAKLRAAREALDGGQGGQGAGDGSAGGSSGAPSSDGSAGTSPGGSGSSGSGGSGSGASGSDTASQVASQVGQQVGQLGQTLAQSVQGLAQIPGQIMQGVQGIVQAAVGAGGTGGALDDRAERDGKGEADDHEARHGGKGNGEPQPGDGAQPGGKGEGGPAPRDKTEPGSKGHGPVPDVPVQRSAPAQTRPQQSPL
jgi:hypothetical protein